MLFLLKDMNWQSLKNRIDSSLRYHLIYNTVVSHDSSSSFQISDSSYTYQFSSVTQSCPTLCNPIDCRTPSLPVHHRFPDFTQTHVHWVGDVIQPSHPCHPLLLPPSIFPSIRVFSNESALHIMWPKYWSLSFNISPSDEHSGLISFRVD